MFELDALLPMKQIQMSDCCSCLLAINRRGKNFSSFQRISFERRWQPTSRQLCTRATRRSNFRIVRNPQNMLAEHVSTSDDPQPPRRRTSFSVTNCYPSFTGMKHSKVSSHHFLSKRRATETARYFIFGAHLMKPQTTDCLWFVRTSKVFGIFRYTLVII